MIPFVLTWQQTETSQSRCSIKYLYLDLNRSQKPLGGSGKKHYLDVREKIVWNEQKKSN